MFISICWWEVFLACRPVWVLVEWIVVGYLVIKYLILGAKILWVQCGTRQHLRHSSASLDPGFIWLGDTLDSNA
jgi:hypothetical protein